MPHTDMLPIELVHVRLSGLGLPRGYTPADEVATQTALDGLHQVVASGACRLVILDGIHEAVAVGVLDVEDLRRLVRCATDGIEIAMTLHWRWIGVFQ